MRTPLIAGNWKMHKTLPEARDLVQGIRDGLPAAAGPGGHAVDVLICPPVQLLFPMAKAVAGTSIQMGAQNVHDEAQGAFTGEVSVAMLKETGCTHVLVGHSERRQLFGETGTWLAKKARSAAEGGLVVVYCVGETLEERESGKTQTVVESQVRAVLGADVPPERLILAYEPVWAIGTGKTATPPQAQEVHLHLRNLLSSVYDKTQAEAIRILYGGSVKPSNATELMACPDIDGGLVGGACLAAEDFLAIIAAAASLGVGVK